MKTAFTLADLLREAARGSRENWPAQAHQASQLVSPKTHEAEIPVITFFAVARGVLRQAPHTHPANEAPVRALLSAAAQALFFECGCYGDQPFHLKD